MNALYELVVVRRRPRAGIRVPKQHLTAPSAVFSMFRKWACEVDREHFLVVCLDGKNGLLGYNTVSVGTLGASLVHPREVFKIAVLANSAALILVHNHPSGDPRPSPEDQRITARLRQAADVVGVSILDHVIIGEGTYYSFAEAGAWPASDGFVPVERAADR